MAKTTNILDLNNRLEKVEKENVAQNNYNSLKNRPKINGNLLTGDKTSAQLGLADAQDVETLKNYAGSRVDISSDLTPAANVSITSAIAQKTGSVVTIGILINTSAEIAANTAIVSGFNYKTAVNDQGVILTKRNAADTYIGRISRDSVDNNKSNLYNLSVIPANTEIRTCLTILV